MFWTDWGLEPSIVRAGMDGSSIKTIIKDNLKWPNGIAIDHGNDRIYWTDAGTDKIETSLWDGDDRRILHSTGVKHPFGIDVLGDDVYWSDWALYEIQVCRMQRQNWTRPTLSNWCLGFRKVTNSMAPITGLW